MSRPLLLSLSRTLLRQTITITTKHPITKSIIKRTSSRQLPQSLTPQKAFSTTPPKMSSSSVFASGNTAVITGGASGIGLALARKCASHGMKVVICDLNASNLTSAKSSITSTYPSSTIETVEMDVSQLSDFQKITSKIPGKINLLSLNAGIGLKGSWAEADYFHKIMDVNLFGVIHGLNALLGQVTEGKGASAVVITGSKQGITNPPGNAAYNASKAAVKTLAEHLSFDLAKTHPGTKVHLLVPGWTFTGLSGNEPFAKEGEGKEKPEGAWTGEQVVEFAEKKMAEGKFYIICPDNDVSEEMDKKRMLYDRLDLVEERMPLSRWREESAQEAKEKIDALKV